MRRKGEGQYAPLSYDLLKSPAWRSLSGAAVKVFLELRTRFHGANNGRLILSLEKAARLLGMGKRKAIETSDLETRVIALEQERAHEKY